MARTLRPVLERAVPRLANLVVAAGALIGGYWAFGEAAVGALRISMALLVVLAAWKPGEALVLLAAFGPLGGALDALTHGATSWTLPLALAFVGGDALGRALRGDRVADRWLIATAAAWGGVVGWSLWSLPNAGAVPGGLAALLATTGVAAYALTNEECLRQSGLGRRVMRALMLGVAAVGALNMNRAVEIVLRRPPSWTAITDVLPSIRVTSTFPDFNAAGALFLLLALFSLSALRDRSLRAAATCSAPFIMAGLWLSGSRTALILLPVGIAILVFRSPAEGSRSRKALVVATVLVVALMVGLLYPQAKTRANAATALGIRREMAWATMRMVRAHPLKGVGIGQYRSRSYPYMATLAHSGYFQENAHNQPLQFAGELGLPGLGLFLLLVVLGAAPIARHAWRSSDPYQLGLAAGVAGFLTASLTMHPLMISEVAISFWLLRGAARAAGTTSQQPPVERHMEHDHDPVVHWRPPAQVHPHPRP